jgi:hypothetical protein
VEHHVDDLAAVLLEKHYQRRQVLFVLTPGEGDGIPVIDF